ncbi:hypothetical protein [Robertkochia solimangrovi]|uniref:hypothetical protein n=1 Tax=Robertkochia solimangrovi TaxID=2213046 RepID=UPI00117DC2BC|nr:hypothetical protein [Robertkochia solimangrovi]TRZ41814.1 hypothetical protein DMZ48_15830 [Robertkochia solimangrovi]
MNNLVIISRIIAYYCMFYTAVKLYAVVFANAAVWPNLILSLPLILFAVIGFIQMKRSRYSWSYVIAGVIGITLLRYFESDLMELLAQYF